MQNIKQIARSILNNKRTSHLLLISLSIGLTAYILVSSKVIYNNSYDTHLDNYKNIYRIVSSTYTDHVLTISQPCTQRILGQSLESSYPGVKQSGYLCGTMENHYKIGDNSFTIENAFHCSTGFTKIFSIKTVQGNSTDLLSKPNMAIISESFAHKYFGNENPIGKTVHQYPAQKFEIEAIFKDFPRNTHFHPDLLISFHDKMHLPPPLKENWGEFSFYTYLELDVKSDLKKLEKGITDLCNENNKNQIKNSNSEYRFSLQAIHDIHTHSQLKNEIGKNIRGDYLRIIQLISVFILIISGFNYIYFSYARISSHSVQYGIRKVLGAKNASLLSQFMIESLIIHSIALIVSAFLISLIFQIPDVFDEFVHFHDLPNRFWTSLFLIFITSSVLNPTVLWLMLINKNSLSLLTHKIDRQSHAFSFRKVFVIVQFVVIIFLISAIIGINRQVNFLKTKDIGIEIKNKLVVKSPSNMRRTSNRVRNLDAFEQELKKTSGVQNVSISNTIPGDIPSFNFSVSEIKDKSGIKTALLIADNNFLRSFNVDIVEGEGFKQSGNSGCIINTICMKQLGYVKAGDIIGKKFYLQDESVMQTIETNVIGVCENFNFTNVKETPDPIVLLDWTEDIMWGKYTLSVDQNIDKKELISQIEKLYHNTFLNYSFDYFWLEDFYNKQFDEENSIIKSLKYFALIAILLGILSMLSMVLQISLERTKEIGIRKVNGAKRIDIIRLLNLNMVKWIGIAGLIAIPLSWYFLSNWLSSFSYQTNISIWIFVISAGIAFFIGIITVTIQSLKVASMNPVESIKYE